VTTIKVMSAGAVQSMVTALGAEFERASGNTLDLNFNTAGSLRERFTKGEHPDLLILPAAVMEALDKEGAFVPGTRVALGRTVTGVTVKEGAAVPDISTPDAFKQALLAARTVAYTDPKAGGSSGTFFAGLLQKLGIADEVNKNEPAKAIELEHRSLEKLKSIGVKVVDVDKSGFIAISDPYLDRLSRELGPHAEKIKTLIRSIN